MNITQIHTQVAKASLSSTNRYYSLILTDFQYTHAHVVVHMIVYCTQVVREKRS